MQAAETLKNSLGMILGAGVGGFLVTGGVGWLIHRFWRNSAACAFIPAGLQAAIQVGGASADPRQMDYALISVLMGVIWWQLWDRVNAKQDARRRREEEERWAREAKERRRYY